MQILKKKQNIINLYIAIKKQKQEDICAWKFMVKKWMAQVFFPYNQPIKYNNKKILIKCNDNVAKSKPFIYKL